MPTGSERDGDRGRGQSNWNFPKGQEGKFSGTFEADPCGAELPSARGLSGTIDVFPRYGLTAIEKGQPWGLLHG